MTSLAPPASSRPTRRPLVPAGCALALVIVTLVAYHNSLRVPFLFDDLAAILDNPTLEHFGSALFPARDSGSPVSGRPVVNLSLAANYAVSGTAVWSYHVVNLAIHVLAGLTLFGIVRRTLRQSPLRDRFGAAAAPLALIVAAIWMVHPLQTEAVTYVSQRAEALMGLFYLLTLYFFIRGAEAAPDKTRERFWLGLSFAACLLGMASKEVMVSAPLLVFVYDRTFCAGSVHEAWRRRSRFYLGLIATWLLLAALVASTKNRGGTAGFGSPITVAAYTLTQSRAVVRYLALAIWPRSLVFDYGTELAAGMAQILPSLLVVLALLVATAFALWRRPALGFLGLWFFATLAPSSSIVPVSTQTMAEHRMYLPLAAVVTLFVSGLYSRLDRRAFGVGIAIAIMLAALTVRRNADYESALGLWGDTAAKRPANARAQLNLGNELTKAARWDEAIARYREAVRLKPDYTEARYDLGNALLATRQTSEAILQYREALRLNSALPEIHYNLGNALVEAGREAEAIPSYAEAIRLKPDHAKAHFNLGNALAAAGRFPEAIAHYEKARQINPAAAEVQDNLGNALTEAGRPGEALPHYAEALRLDPANAETHNNFGTALLQAGRVHDAIAQYETALQLKPNFAAARQNLDWALHQAAQAGLRP